MTAKSVTPNRHNNINEPPLLRAVFYWSLIMELPDKTQKEMSEAIKIMAVSAFTEKSQNLIPLDYVAALVGCPYQHTANVIVKQPSFPKGVRLKEKSHPRWIAGEVIRWCRINAKRIK